jgi:hypothetical protein
MLHHYTSINTLALILANRKIRFSRLDKVDDLTETTFLPKRFNTYYFVSCWTKSESENISLWHMYTQMKGVKISFPHTPFLMHRLKPSQFSEITLKSEINFPIPNTEFIQTHSTGFKFIFVPYGDDFEPFDIIYCDDNEQRIRDSFSSTTNADNTKQYIIKNTSPAIVKNTIWKFQNECRFILKLLPVSVIDQFERKHNAEDLLEILSVEQEYFDIELDQDILNNIVITLGPNTSEADKTIVQVLLNEFTTNGKLIVSELTGKIRPK